MRLVESTISERIVVPSTVVELAATVKVNRFRSSIADMVRPGKRVDSQV